MARIKNTSRARPKRKVVWGARNPNMTQAQASRLSNARASARRRAVNGRVSVRGHTRSFPTRRRRS